MRDYQLKTKTIPLGDFAADSTALTYALLKCPNAMKIVAVRLGVKATVTAADTNYSTATLKNGSNNIATLANGPASTGVTIAAGAFGSFTLDTSKAECAKDDVLTLAFAKTGNGLAWTGTVLQIDYYDYNN